jgi:hypothetical protein
MTDQLELFELAAADAGEVDLALPPVYDQDTIVEEALRWYRRNGFPYRTLPRHVVLQEVNRLARMPTDRLWTTTAGYQAADTYHPQRFEARAAGMRSPYDAFHDDDLLRRALRLTLEYGQAIGTELLSKLLVVSGTQACANFRPGVALALYRTYAPDGGVVLDTCHGYGGRLLGFAAWPAGSLYIGIDASLVQHAGNVDMASSLGVSERCYHLRKPAEDVDSYELPAPPGGVDLCVTSPPYFAKELYSEDEDQSWRRYPDPDAWRGQFLEPLLRLHATMLRPGGYTIVNIAPVKLGGTVHDLPTWTLIAGAAAGLVPETSRHMLQLSRRFGRGLGADISAEPFVVLRRPL